MPSTSRPTSPGFLIALHLGLLIAAAGLAFATILTFKSATARTDDLQTFDLLFVAIWAGGIVLALLTVVSLFCSVVTAGAVWVDMEYRAAAAAVVVIAFFSTTSVLMLPQPTPGWLWIVWIYSALLGMAILGAKQFEQGL